MRPLIQIDIYWMVICFFWVHLARINADRKELELNLRRGEYILVADVMKMWPFVVQEISARIMLMPPKISPRVLGLKTIPEIREVIRKIAKEIVDEIAKLDIMEIAAKADIRGLIALNVPDTDTNQRTICKPKK